MNNFFWKYRYPILLAALIALFLGVYWMVPKLAGVKSKGIRVTIPEGLNAGEIGELVAAKLPEFNEENFKILASAREGYLFPDTYYFYPWAEPEEVIRILGDTFIKRTEPLKKELEDSDKKLEEIIIMASLIEREIGPEDDRAVVAGILWKRIKEGMRLEVDAAPETYERYGLPRRPLGNPGLESIEAALHPKDSPYFYYLHDERGKIHYAESYEKHKANIKNFLTQ